jgi:hypothetical protein
MSLVLRSNLESSGRVFSLSLGEATSSSCPEGLDFGACSKAEESICLEFVSCVVLFAVGRCIDAELMIRSGSGVASGTLLGVRMPGRLHPFLVSHCDANFPYGPRRAKTSSAILVVAVVSPLSDLVRTSSVGDGASCASSALCTSSDSSTIDSASEESSSVSAAVSL